MCQRWMDSFQNFLADMGECPPRMTIGRIDVNRGYEPSNCRWETSFEQARSRRDNVWVEHEGKKMILKDYAAVMGVPYKRLHALRKYKGLTAEQAVRHLLALKE